MSIACVCGHGIHCPVHPDIPAYTSTTPYADPSVPIETLDDEWEAAVTQAESQRAARAILDEQNRAGQREAVGALFSMCSAERDSAAVNAARMAVCPNCRPGDPCHAHAAGSC